MRGFYVLATGGATPVPLEQVREDFASEEVTFAPHEGGWGFSLRADGASVEVSFSKPDEGDWARQAKRFSGSDEAHERLRKSRGSYAIAFEPGAPQPSVAVFEALWCARVLIDRADGVLVDLTASKLHMPSDVTEITELEFDIRDHVSLHAVEVPPGSGALWVHSHGMEKFGARNVEIFRLSEADLPAAESFLHELCTDLAFGQAPEGQVLAETSEGQGFVLADSEQARQGLIGIPLETFEGHEDLHFTVISPEGRHTTSDLLAPYRDRFADEPPERSEALWAQAQALLPAFKARFGRKGLMEPLTFLARAAFEIHPEQEPTSEDLWMEILGWDESKLVGKLVDGSAHTTEWRKGARVELDESAIDAIALGREGRPLDDEEMRTMLDAELPV